MFLRDFQVLRRDLNPERRTEPARIEHLRVREAFAEILSEVTNKTERLTASRTSGSGHVDVPITHYMPPTYSQERHILAAAHGQVPMPSPARLTLTDSDVQPICLSTLNEADELRKIGTCLVGLDYVGAISQRE